NEFDLKGFTWEIITFRHFLNEPSQFALYLPLLTSALMQHTSLWRRNGDQKTTLPGSRVCSSSVTVKSGDLIQTPNRILKLSVAAVAK
ncbi:hypothetical protein KUCAC02_025482, partial [Chaenocephalus aceratus]